MRATLRGELPKDLVRARNGFEAWRGRRQGRDRIPRRLWALAVRLVRIHGVSRTSVALGLDYYSLKKRAEAAGLPSQSSDAPSRGPAFVELSAPIGLGKQCVFELDNGAGVGRRVQLLGYDAAEIEVLARTFWNAE